MPSGRCAQGLPRRLDENGLVSGLRHRFSRHTEKGVGMPTPLAIDEASIGQSHSPIERDDLDRLLLLQSGWPSAPERTVRTRLQISVDVVDIRSDVGVVGEPLHD